MLQTVILTFQTGSWSKSYECMRGMWRPYV